MTETENSKFNWPLAAFALVVNKEGQVLTVTRRGNLEGLSFPGGKAKPGESAEEACIREVREETGITISKLREVYREDYSFAMHHVVGFVADEYSGTLFSAEEGIYASWGSLGAVLHESSRFHDYNRKLVRASMPERLIVMGAELSLEIEQIWVPFFRYKSSLSNSPTVTWNGVYGTMRWTVSIGDQERPLSSPSNFFASAWDVDLSKAEAKCISHLREIEGSIRSRLSFHEMWKNRPKLTVPEGVKALVGAMPSLEGPLKDCKTRRDMEKALEKTLGNKYNEDHRVLYTLFGAVE